jgi:anti-sigma factor RsiW
MDREALDAWVDGALAGEEARRTVAAHVAACPDCAAYTAQLRAHKDRLARYRPATAPAALPSGLWEATRAALDHVEARRHADGSRQHRPAPRRHRLSMGVATALAAIFVVALATAVALRHRPGTIVPVRGLLATPLPPASGITFNTDDPDRAANWLGHRLNAEIAPVNLSLSGARLVATWADRTANRGTLIYRSAQGVPIALYLFLAPGTTLPPLPRVTFNGSTYRVAEIKMPPAAAAAWQADGRAYVAAASLPLYDLLPYVHEMDRSCRRRR